MMVYNVYYEILYSIMKYLYLLEGLYKKPRLKNEFIIKYYSHIILLYLVITNILQSYFSFNRNE